MRVSVALATYNGQKYLQEQLHSLSRQRRLPDELIVTDDGSSDSTFEILEAFAAESPFPTRIFRNSHNMGFRNNFDHVLSLCTGDVIFLCDQDDVWLPGRIEYVHGLFEEDRGAFCVMNDAYICDENLEHDGSTIFSNGLDVVGSCTAIRRPFLDIVLPVPLEAESHDAWIRELAVGLGIRRLTPVVLQLWRRHESAVSRWVTAGSHVQSPGPKGSVRRSKTFKRLRYLHRLGYRGHYRQLCRQCSYLKLVDLRLGQWLRDAPRQHSLRTQAVAFHAVVPQRAQVVRRRIALLERPRLLRIPSAVRMLCTHRFRRYYTFRDALVDLWVTE